VVLTSAQIGDVLSGRLSEVRFPIDQPPAWAVGEVVRLLRHNEEDPRPRRSSVYVRVTDWYAAPAASGEGEEWVVEFRPATAPHETRLLTPAARPKGSEHGYTNLPGLAMGGSTDPGEAVDDATLEQFRRDAEERFRRHRVRLARARAHERSKWPLDVRMRKAAAAAKQNGIDVRSELRDLRRMRSRGRPEGVLAEQMARIERMAYREPDT